MEKGMWEKYLPITYLIRTDKNSYNSTTKRQIPQFKIGHKISTEISLKNKQMANIHMKMLNIIHHPGNAHDNCKIPLYTTRW